MGKISNIYLDVDPFKIIETGFHKDRDKVSESIFSLGNEYCGIRGTFDEGYSGDTLLGCYFNGIYEYALEDTPNAYKGIVKRTHFTINSVNWIKCKISADDETLDLNVSSFENFRRELDMKNGLLTREFIWNSKKANIRIAFKRLLNMTYCHECIQQIEFVSDKDVNIHLEMSLDSNVLHWSNHCYWDKDKEFSDKDVCGISVKTPTTNQSLVSVMKIEGTDNPEITSKDKEITASYDLALKAKSKVTVTRFVINLVDKESNSHIDEMIASSKKELSALCEKGFENSVKENEAYFDKVWERNDIEIKGDDLNQQGIRYCIFQMEQTYHGYAKDNNIGAKGLTGEAYSGHAFWDSETYCLPYYLFSNKEACKNLLMFRYNTLKEAKDKAAMLDCEGAAFPIATRNGYEACNLWQHASLQLQPSTAVFYAIYHYMNLYDDREFMQDYGIELLLEISKFLLSRGQYNQDHTKFSYYGVMGPDEFQMMVNHNTYTNFMAKKTFDYVLGLLDSKEYKLDDLLVKCNFTQKHIEKMKDASAKMVILYDEKSGLFEQSDGFFDLPHIDIHSIPTNEFPLYSHWSYDRIYRNDMIKQPDVLMFMFLYNQDFTYEQKKANYEYYEPRCIHESSLSPSIHSIFACELNKKKEARDFFSFATRLDLDDYNCNTCEGIHTTSIAAAWMNIVYGFGGLRSDRKTLVLNPMIIDEWESYSFGVAYHDAKIKVIVSKNKTEIIVAGKPVELKVYGKEYTVKDRLVVER